MPFFYLRKGLEVIFFICNVGLHSHLGYSLRLLVRYEQDEVCTKVDIHTLVWESSITRQDVRDILIMFETFSFSLTRDWFTDMSPRASRRDENRSRVWKTRRIYPSHSRSCLVSWCLDKNVNQVSDGSSKLTLIINCFQTREHEKLITTFFTGYFPSPPVCYKNSNLCWKLLWTIICSLELEKLIIIYFKKKMKKCEFVTTDTYISKYTDISYTYISISNAIYRYFQNIDISLSIDPPKSPKYWQNFFEINFEFPNQFSKITRGSSQFIQIFLILIQNFSKIILEFSTKFFQHLNFL